MDVTDSLWAITAWLGMLSVLSSQAVLLLESFEE